MAGVRFRSDGSTEATDGCLLIRVTAKTPPSEEHPKDKPSDELEPFTVPTETATKVLKSIPKRHPIPVLETAVLDVDATNHGSHNGSARFVTSDLENDSVTETQKIDFEYPNTDPFFETAVRNEQASFIQYLDLLLLEKIIKAAKEFQGTGSRKAIRAQFSFNDSKSPVVITVRNPGEGSEMVSLLMPMAK
jgi:hypothetical protein